MNIVAVALSEYIDRNQCANCWFYGWEDISVACDCNSAVLDARREYAALV